MKSNISFREFGPALRFLLIFVATYISGNVLYGIYVEFFRPSPDPLTISVTRQVAFILTKSSDAVNAVISATEPIVLLTNPEKTVIRVFEGCNGLNVMIVFGSFVIAFGGKAKSTLLYLAGGCLVLHVANLLRIILLYETALYRPLFFYYFHKYFFTAVLYLVVLALWFQWTRMKSLSRASAEA